jgi:hypothetical protein
MRKLLALGFLLALTVFFGSPAVACEITCPGGGKCSSTNGDCHCDGQSPHCTDNPQKVTEAYVEYLQTWNTPGLNKAAEAASLMLEASNANDLTAHERATRSYNEALQRLTKAERRIVSAWEADKHELNNRER